MDFFASVYKVDRYIIITSKCFKRPHRHSKGYNLFTIGSNDHQRERPEKKSKKSLARHVFVITTESKKIIVTTPLYTSQGKSFQHVELKIYILIRKL